MAGTVKLPGVGTVPTKYAVGGVVVVVGIAGFFWIRYINSQSAAAAAGDTTTTDTTGTDEYTYPAYATDYAPDQSYDGGAYPYPTYTTPSYGLTTTVQTVNPTTNSEWTQRSVEYLESVGVDATNASLSVSRYLLKECLSATQADIVRQAVAGMGTPPQGTYNITTCPDGTATGGQPVTAPPAPTGLKAKPYREHVDLDWEPVKDVQGYTIWADGIRKTSNYFSTEHVWNLKPNTSHRLEVAAFRVVNGNYLYGPRASITVKTLK